MIFGCKSAPIALIVRSPSVQSVWLSMSTAFHHFWIANVSVGTLCSHTEPRFKLSAVEVGDPTRYFLRLCKKNVPARQTSAANETTILCHNPHDRSSWKSMKVLHLLTFPGELWTLHKSHYITMPASLYISLGPLCISWSVHAMLLVELQRGCSESVANGVFRLQACVWCTSRDALTKDGNSSRKVFHAVLQCFSTALAT